ncbi:MAG TPA: calcium-binding protein, partial [Candidatus Binatia bacterium]|nr:calcium-binding protein [Candidatus Binatia bacterium]
MGTWTPGPGATGGNDTFTGDASAEVADGLGGDDTLNGGDGADTLRGGAGSDSVFGGGGDDTMLLDEGEADSGETYDGGAGMDTLQVAGSVGLIGATVSFERLTFVAGAFGVNAAAFSSAGLPSTTLLVTGSGLVDIVQINISPAETDISLAGWTFASWTDVTDHVNVFGTALGNHITGSSGSDWLLGDDGADVLLGGGGSDQLSPSFDAADGDTDEMHGQAGNDLYGVFEASDQVFEAAGEGTDSVAAWISYTLGPNVENLSLHGSATAGGGNSLDNNITGNANDNSLFGQSGNDFLSGGDGADTLNGGIGLDGIDGGAGNDTINWTWNDGADFVDGGADADTIFITDGASSNILNASWNGTVLTNAAGVTLLNMENINANMGGGTDWLIYTATDAVAVDLSTGFASGFSFLAGVERVVGGTGNDDLSGDTADNRLDGGAGNDTLDGGAGVDLLIGGAGDDWMSGSSGNDSLQGDAGNDEFNWANGDGRDTINGGADFDTFNAAGQGVAELGNVTWNGSVITALMDNALVSIEAINFNLAGGVDWLIYNASAAVTVNLGLGTASGFSSVSNIEKVIGGSGGDTLTGDGFDNRLDGQGGDDTLDGGAGIDAVLGGDGGDVIHASAGNDSLQGQAGNDTFHWTTADGRDTFNGGADTDTANLTGSAAADVADANWNGSVITGLMNNALIDVELINLDLGAGGSAGDWLKYNTSAGVTVNLGAGTASGFASITGVENIIGGSAG